MKFNLTDIDKIVKHFGGVRELASFLKITKQAIYLWISNGEMPELRAYQLEDKTKGKLRYVGK